jgi:hypothetical protein
MLYLRHDIYNMKFKIKHKLYIASGSAPLPQENIVGTRQSTPTPSYCTDLRSSK